MNPFGNLKNHWKYLKTTWFKPFKQWKPERIFFFEWLNFSAPHEKSTFGGPALSSHVTVDLGVNHGEDSRWITVKKPFYFHGFLFLGSFLASKMEKKPPNQQSFFHFYPENWGRWTHFWRAYFSKGLVQPPTSCSFLSTLCPPKVSHHPQSSSWYLPRSVFFFWLWKFPARNGWLIFAQEETSEVAGGESWWGSVSWKNGRLLFVHFYQLEGPLKPATFVSLKKGKNQVFQVGR